MIFERYHEKDKTQITGRHFDTPGREWFFHKEGKTVKKIVGYDANALCLHCLGEEMCCGKLYWLKTSDWVKYKLDLMSDSSLNF